MDNKPFGGANKIFVNAVQKFLLLQAEPKLGDERFI